MNEWILVKDRLPDFIQTDYGNDFVEYKASKRVLVTLNCNRDYVFISRYTDEGWLDDNGHELADVVAWMPFPEPYKGVD